MAKVVIFGTKDLASLAHYYLKFDSEHEVVAFTVDKEFIEDHQFQGLPVVPFEEITLLYPPSEFSMFIPMTQRGMGKEREKKYLTCKKNGYKFISYVSSKATTWPDLSIGENCFIFEDNTIQPFVKIGNNVILWSGNHIGHHSIIEDHVFVTSQVVISGHVKVGRYSFFGVNSSLRDGITIGEATFVGMGASVTKNTDPFSVLLAPESVRKTNVAMKSDFKEYDLE